MIKINQPASGEIAYLHEVFGKKRAEELVLAALKIRQNAYAPYSKFMVGAAILAASGKIYVGCNVECADYDGTHAEEAALAAMVAAGERTPLAVIVYGGLEGSEVTRRDTKTPPCGKCRQKLHEFASLSGFDLYVALCVGPESRFKLTPISEILPRSFGPASIGVDLVKYRR